MYPPAGPVVNKILAVNFEPAHRLTEWPIAKEPLKLLATNVTRSSNKMAPVIIGRETEKWFCATLRDKVLCIKVIHRKHLPVLHFPTRNSQRTNWYLSRRSTATVPGVTAIICGPPPHSLLLLQLKRNGNNPSFLSQRESGVKTVHTQTLATDRRFNITVILDDSQ